MDFLGWLEQPGIVIFVPLAAALLSGLVAFSIALMNLLVKDAQLRRLNVLDKLASLSKEAGKVDARLTHVIEFEIQAELMNRRVRPESRWLYPSIVTVFPAIGLTIGIVIYEKYGWNLAGYESLDAIGSLLVVLIIAIVSAAAGAVVCAVLIWLRKRSYRRRGMRLDKPGGDRSQPTLPGT